MIDIQRSEVLVADEGANSTKGDMINIQRCEDLVADEGANSTKGDMIDIQRCEDLVADDGANESRGRELLRGGWRGTLMAECARGRDSCRAGKGGEGGRLREGQGRGGEEKVGKAEASAGKTPSFN